jgi:ABC-2 type transport system ATP-binding protein
MAIIEVEQLRKRYGDRTAVDDLSFTVEPGEIFGVVGPNGAGKTTTVECITGLRSPDSGTIRIVGRDPQRDATEIHQRVGIQLQETQLPDRLRVAEALDLYASFYDHPADWRALLDDWGLADVQNSSWRTLSGGQKQRLAIALALVGSPKVAVLDELTTGLDPQGRRDTWRHIAALRERGVTILLVTHFMEEADELCDRIAVISGGRLVALDSPSGLVASVGAGQRVRFRPSAPLPAGLLEALPEVSTVEQTGGQTVVTGDGNLLTAVTAVLARHQIVAVELRLDQANLDDAYVALTGKEVR